MIKQLRAELRSVLLRQMGADDLDMHTRGTLEGKRESLLEFLILLKPEYLVEKDTPRECFRTGCSELFVPDAHCLDQKFHRPSCKEIHHGQTRRAKAMGISVEELQAGMKNGKFSTRRRTGWERS